jgi:serine/threonine-protein kinase
VSERAEGARVRWQRVQAVFHHALELPDQERDAFLDGECGADAALQVEVRELLAAHEQGPIGRLGDGRSTDAVLEFVGPFRIVRRLAEGGMGVVYLAEREGPDFTQRVALKLIRSGFTDPQLERRLRLERGILAQLEHPGIARFIDGGATPSGQAYCAMEYVEGTDILTYCDDRRLAIPDRVELFVEVCEAVQHAHQRLIVHRDLKPSNILVTADGHTKLLDFGIAKVLDAPGRADPTRTSHWFTPAYASPEQVRRQPVDTASDIYALGMLLYELLTGRRPYDTEGLPPARIEQVICEQTPLRPSQVLRSATGDAGDERLQLYLLARKRATTPERLNRQLRRDLDTIVLKAIAKEPNRRYASVDQLAEDLRRYLDGRPVLAQPDSRRYRAAKFFRRHRGATMFAALAVLSLAAGAVGAATQAARASRERDRAEAALGDAQRALRRSENLSTFLLDLLETSDPYGDVKDTVASRAVLREAVVRAQALRGQPELQALLYDALGRSHEKLRRLDEARALLEQAVDIRRERLGPDSPETLESMRHLAGVLNRLGEHDRAETMYRDVLTRQRAMYGGDTPETATTLVELAHVLPYKGRSAEAIELFEEAATIRRRTLGTQHPAVADVLDVLSNLVRANDVGRAEALLREALAIRQASLGDDDPRVAGTLLRLGDMAWMEHQNYEEAEQLLRRALEIQRRAYGDVHLSMIHGLHSLASIRVRTGRLREAEAFYDQTLDIERQVLGPDNPSVAETLGLLGNVLLQQGRYAAAERAFRESRAMWQRTFGPNHHTIATATRALGRLYLARGEDARAEDAFREALAIYQTALAPDHPHVGATLMSLARVQIRRREYAAAERGLQEALRIYRLHYGEQHERVRDAYGVLVELHEAWGRRGQAARYRALASGNEERTD